MKRYTMLSVLPSIVVGLALLSIQGCKKDEPQIAPTVTTAAATTIAQVSATSGGSVTSAGSSAVKARGVCWSTGATPTVTDSKTSDGDGTGNFTSNLTGLTPSTLYNIRAYATNSVGITYGSVVSFTTLALLLPELTTTAATDVTNTTATSGGNVTSDDGLPVTTRGVCWSTGATPTITDGKTTDGTGTGIFVSSLTGLSAGTTYNVRAYATTTAGTGYGSVQSFTTLQIPTVTTAAISSILVITASGGGNVTATGGTAITDRGICWSTTASPTVIDSKTTDGSATGAFTSSLTGLVANSTYHVRAYAVNSIGTAYGNELTFTTYGVVDIDGNTYHSVVIGTQEWMKENLKTKTNSDGTAIPNITTATDWAALTTGAFVAYNNSNDNAAIYGELYNWYAVTDAHLLCPTGWHAPSDDEWNDLVTFLGGDLVAGGKMKATGTLQAGTGRWNTPNTDATNSSNFTGLPGGHRDETGAYNDVNSYGHWWSTLGDINNAYFRRLQDSHGKLERFGNASKVGKSVRCIKD